MTKTEERRADMVQAITEKLADLLCERDALHDEITATLMRLSLLQDRHASVKAEMAVLQLRLGALERRGGRA